VWRRAYEEYVLAPVALVEAVLPGMRSRGFGRVVNLSSTAVREPLPNLVLSAVHRTGALAAFKSIARLAAPDGVTLNTLMVGRAGTEALVHIYGSEEETQAAAEREVPAQRVADVSEIADIAAFLCSARAAYITGAAIPVDGGLLQSL
jgi:3-oxoacyl-[acyl-carrier protein] reductase